MFIFNLTVEPGSNHMRWDVRAGNPELVLVCHHKEPDDSKTVNTDIITSLAQALGINHSKVHIVMGVEARHKRIKISEEKATYQELLKKLGVSA